jgi:hypothetical protein
MFQYPFVFLGFVPVASDMRAAATDNMAGPSLRSRASMMVDLDSLTTLRAALFLVVAGNGG